MTKSGRQARRRLERVMMAAALASTWAAAGPVRAAEKYVLIYYRQMGNNLNSGALTMETHVFQENGTKAVNVGVTNPSNPGSPIFGFTDFNGWNRVTFDDNNCAYDVTIYAPGVAKDASPGFNWQNPLVWPFHYSYVTHWLHVSDATPVTASPASPVYHYDLVNGLNQVSGFNPGCQPTGWVEAPGAYSDQSELGSGAWASYQAQTFVAPAGVNRIISAMAFLTRGAGDGPFYYNASVHQGSPTGPQIGPTVLSPQHHSVNFKEETVCWGINDVPVTPGQTYALKLTPVDGAGCNVWRTVADNYPGGSVYHGATQGTGHDMVAVIVGIGLNIDPPTISRSPASFTRQVDEGGSLPNDTFTVANSGGGLLVYSISDNATWLSVNPTNGDSAAEPDMINIVYGVDGLADGPYVGTITIDAPGATNTPQTVVVNLTVNPSLYAPCDFDQDGDVDQEDFGDFQACYTGPGVAQTDEACAGARLDPDEDVDMSDFALFQGCISGPNSPADPDCAE